VSEKRIRCRDLQNHDTRGGGPVGRTPGRCNPPPHNTTSGHEHEDRDRHPRHARQAAQPVGERGSHAHTAESGCLQASNPQEISDTDREKYGNCANELEELIPALEELHRIARQAMWNIANRAKAFEALEKTTATQRREAIAIMKTAPNPLYYDVINAICDELGVSRTLYSEAVIEWLKSGGRGQCVSRRRSASGPGNDSRNPGSSSSRSSSGRLGRSSTSSARRSSGSVVNTGSAAFDERLRGRSVPRRAIQRSVSGMASRPDPLSIQER
jgi:hypothetical protein